MGDYRLATQLHQRLLSLGFDVKQPRRIWLGRGHDNGDWWRWQAIVRGTEGAARIGCNMSMKACVGMSDSELRERVETNG